MLLDVHHYEKMGSALWLYSWLILRQTHQSGSIGWVLGGAPITYREIEEETGFNRRTIEGWFRKLRRGGYIETSVAPTGVVVRITKSKKFAQTPRRIAEGVRGVAGTSPQTCVAFDSKSPLIEQVPGGIGSSSVARIKDKRIAAPNQKHFHTEIHNPNQRRLQEPFGLEENPHSNSSRNALREEIESSPFNNEQQHYSFNARERLRLIRWERDEAVRRELRVGTGPEVSRS
ncbi:MAG: hypothetical protein ACRD59_15310 [Candidatus Acidiferrales bacterium]